ncbi:MAG: alpha-L-fucosidase [Planctomycetota bacterium]
MSKMKSVLLLVCLLSSIVLAGGKKEVNIPTPRPAQLAWQEAELGVLFSYDIHTFTDGDYWPQKGDEPIEDLDVFNPTQLDTDQWVRTAKDMGAEFAIFTGSHVAGFSLWQSDANPYSLKSTKWGDGKRDIFGEFVASCRKYGIKPGVFLGTRMNAHLQVFRFKATEKSKVTQEEYNRLIEKEVEEICSRYGDLFELWFDGGAYGRKQGGPDVLGIFEKYQPNAHFYHSYERADSRWGGSETGTVPYPCWATFPYKATGSGENPINIEIRKNGFRLSKQGDPNGTYWVPAMSDTPLRNFEWFWEKGDEHKIKSLKALVDKYYKSVGRNSTLIIGLAPDRRGLLQDVDVKRCQEFGKAIREIFSNKIAETLGKGNTLELALPSDTSFDHLVIQEDIQHGERVRQFKVESFSDGKWTELNTGSCIGHKRIVKLNKPVVADKLRLTVSESMADPIIKTFAVYDSLNPKKPK